MPAKSPAKGFESRLSAGSLKNKKIALPDEAAARPTRLRLRQAILNMLVSRLELKGATALDLCCGSGALGLELYSRGASSVTLVDTNTATAAANVQSLGVGARVKVVQADARRYAPASPANIILADPPYASGLAQQLLARRAQLGKPGSWWVVEVGAAEALDWTGFTDVREQTYGVSKLGLARQL